MLRFYVLHRKENPATAGTEWVQKVYLCGYFHPKQARRLQASEGYQNIQEGERTQ